MKDPGPKALAQSKLLSAKICEIIRKNAGKISFAEFMQQALYAPGLGYYSSGTTKFGSKGDFVTAPELGSLFAKSLARQCAQILTQCKSGSILEIGAGTGQLACDLLQELDQLNIQLDQYLILELSADLRARQQQRIQAMCPQFFHKVQFLENLPNPAISAVIIANEVMDAMPVHRFCYQNKQLFEYYVTEDNAQLSSTLQAASDDLSYAFVQSNLEKYLAKQHHEYSSEINLWLPAWLRSLSSSLRSGAILLFDYGFPRAEYYHPQRTQGTLMCHYQHQAHGDPFWYPGLQDITAHVDFTAVAEAAYASNLAISGFTNLAGFLINCGITEIYDSTKQARELNILCSAAEMGELFKAMILSKMPETEFLGFRQFDKLFSL